MNTAQYVTLMLKALGAAFIAHGCATVCRECGKASLADCVELAGKIEIILLCLPLVKTLVETANGLMSF